LNLALRGHCVGTIIKGFYLACGTAPVTILPTSILTLLPFIQDQVAALATDGGEITLTMKTFFHQALSAAPILIDIIPIITHFPGEKKLTEAITTKLGMSRAYGLNAVNFGAHPSLFYSTGSRTPISIDRISIITFLPSL
jgi:hypothetical protein